MTDKAKDQLDWFKFETRIRKIMMELVDPSVKRTREMEGENRFERLAREKVVRRLDDAEYAIQKLEQKATA